MREDTFDKLNRVVSRKDALGNITTNSYDAAGNLTGVQSGGLSRTMTYDALNRLTNLTATGGISIDFTYDAAGNRAQMVDATGTTTYTYNAANRMTQQAVPGGKSIRYAYNAASQLTKVTDYGNNATTYTRDAVGRVTGAQFADGANATFGYDAAGNRTSLTLPGLATSYTYDADNRVTGLTNSNGSGQTLGSYSYTYDAAHNLVSQTDAKGQTQYTYDADDRLTNAVQPSGATTTYAYDAAGNRASMADASGTTTYTYDAANRLLKEDSAAGTKTYAWDANGNQLSDGSAQYEYDSLNRLTAVTVQGQRVTYSYDGDGMMVARTAGGSTTRFYLDGQRVINEGDGAGAITAAMFRGAGLSLGRKVGTAPTAYYLYNAHGDVVGVANSAGDQLASYEYDAFGVLTASTGSFDNPYRYAGEYFDYTTGQYYLRARFYSPRTGRFLSQDTVLGEYNDPLSLHLYTYVESNPLTRVDPSGHAFACTQTCDTAEGGNLEPTTPQLMEQRLLSAGFTQKAIDHYGTGQLGQVLDVYQGAPGQLQTAVDELNTAAQRIADGSFAKDEKAVNVGLVGASLFLAPAAAVVAPEVVVAAATSPEIVAGATWLASNGEDTVNAVVNCSGGLSPECAASLAPLAVPGQQTTGKPIPQKVQGTEFENYVQATKLKKLDEKGMIRTQEVLPTPDIPGKKFVKPDFTIENANGGVAAYADAKSGKFVPFDEQALGLIKWTEANATSKTLIYYTSGSATKIDPQIYQVAQGHGVRVLKVQVQ